METWFGSIAECLGDVIMPGEGLLYLKNIMNGLKCGAGLPDFS
jgi:hypothetical protein